MLKLEDDTDFTILKKKNVQKVRLELQKLRFILLFFSKLEP